MSGTPSEGGFLAALFDLSFTRFVTTRLVRILFVLTLVLLVLAYVAIAIAIFSDGDTGEGVGWLVVVGPLLLFFYTLAYRVFFELVVVVFRIYETSREQLEIMRLEGGGAER
jgi:uncharacterized membrane protein